MDLTNVSTRELKAELGRRNEREIKALTPLENPDFKDLITLIVNGTSETAENGYEDEDFPHYVYEAAMTSVYGPNYFDWLNVQITLIG